MVPPLILQPIVENAVKHGIQQSLRKGVVTIKTEQTGSDIKICISDNGIGIPAKKIEEILRKEQLSHGLSNVNQRLINLYGEKYALQIFSEEGKGTRIWLHIPLHQTPSEF